MVIFIAKPNNSLVPLGILIVHSETNAPLFLAKTPMSGHLLTSYSKGFRFFQQNEINGRCDELICKPNDPASFISLGTKYYALAHIEIFKRDDCFIDLTKKIIIVDGTSYTLTEL